MYRLHVPPTGTGAGTGPGTGTGAGTGAGTGGTCKRYIGKLCSHRSCCSMSLETSASLTTPRRSKSLQQRHNGSNRPSADHLTPWLSTALHTSRLALGGMGHSFESTTVRAAWRRHEAALSSAYLDAFRSLVAELKLSDGGASLFRRYDLSRRGELDAESLLRVLSLEFGMPITLADARLILDRYSRTSTIDAAQFGQLVEDLRRFEQTKAPPPRTRSSVGGGATTAKERPRQAAPSDAQLERALRREEAKNRVLVERVRQLESRLAASGELRPSSGANKPPSRRSTSGLEARAATALVVESSSVGEVAHPKPPLLAQFYEALDFGSAHDEAHAQKRAELWRAFDGNGSGRVSLSECGGGVQLALSSACGKEGAQVYKRAHTPLTPPDCASHDLAQAVRAARAARARCLLGSSHCLSRCPSPQGTTDPTSAHSMTLRTPRPPAAAATTTTSVAPNSGCSCNTSACMPRCTRPSCGSRAPQPGRPRRAVPMASTGLVGSNGPVRCTAPARRAARGQASSRSPTRTRRTSTRWTSTAAGLWICRNSVSGARRRRSALARHAGWSSG